MTKYQRYGRLRAKVRRLEAEVREELGPVLAGLPRRYGFATVKDFCRAVEAACGGGVGNGGRAKRPYTRITVELEAAAKVLVDAGRTPAEIEQQLGISSRSVGKIIKSLKAPSAGRR